MTPLLLLAILLVPSIVLGFLYIEVYFLSTDPLREHASMERTINQKINEILEREGIRMFDIKYEELNDGIEEHKHIIGQYIYTTDAKFEKKLENTRRTVEMMAAEKDLPIWKFFISIESNAKEYMLYLPRILVCKELTVKTFGLTTFYEVVLHELGHHFAAMNGDHDEEEADIQAFELLKREFPRYVRVFFFRSKDRENVIERAKTYLNFFAYKARFVFLTHKMKYL